MIYGFWSAPPESNVNCLHRNLCKGRIDQSSTSPWDTEYRKHRQRLSFQAWKSRAKGSASRGTISCCAKQISKRVRASYCQSRKQRSNQLATSQTSSNPIPRATKVILESSKAKGRSVQTRILDAEEVGSANTSKVPQTKDELFLIFENKIYSRHC